MFVRHQTPPPPFHHQPLTFYIAASIQHHMASCVASPSVSVTLAACSTASLLAPSMSSKLHNRGVRLSIRVLSLNTRRRRHYHYLPAAAAVAVAAAASAAAGHEWPAGVGLSCCCSSHCCLCRVLSASRVTLWRGKTQTPPPLVVHLPLARHRAMLLDGRTKNTFAQQGVHSTCQRSEKLIHQQLWSGQNDGYMYCLTQFSRARLKAPHESTFCLHPRTSTVQRVCMHQPPTMLSAAVSSSAFVSN